MNIFKRKKELKAVAAGQIISLEQVNDRAFSNGMMGCGFAIIQHNGRIHSPISGKVLNIFPTLHAILIQSEEMDIVLIHMGIDTVELNGEPFLLKVKENSQVKAGDVVAEMNLEMLKEKQVESVVIVVLPEVEKGKLMSENQKVGVKETVYKF